MSASLQSFLQYNMNVYKFNKITVVILCGGNGKRMNDYSFPKPLNMINGKPSIYYTLSKLPTYISTVHFVVAPHLVEYNFAEIVSNLNKNIKCAFHYLPYFTRGPIESALLGIINIHEDGPIVFMDNDNMYNFPSDFLSTVSKDNSAFLGYCRDNSGSEAFSFIHINNDQRIMNCKEKIRISNLYCCGIYGFKNIDQFRSIANKVISQYSDQSKELYMSLMYEHMIQHNIAVYGVEFESNLHLGSYQELISNLDIIPNRSMRVCFDLDNTLVTYPVIPGDYTSVKPIKNMIELCNKLKQNGHTIIIHTARRMQTHSYNVGAVIADIANITLQTLKEFDIHYDEIIFGKPLADVYIDDRSVNPYYNDVSMMGLLNYRSDKFPINKLPNNTNNTTVLDGNYVVKSGPSEFMDGEIYFYQNIPQSQNILSFFPKYIKDCRDNNGNSKLYIENINGIPFYTLFQHKMITEEHITQLLEMVKVLHAYNGPILISREDIINNYTDKLKNRFSIKNHYPFDDAEKIQKSCLNALEQYYNNNTNFNISHTIHGDLWFSNIILEYTGKLKFIDMKGKVNGKHTTNGDIYYDYGKLYQSFLGYDAVLYNHSVCPKYAKQLKDIYENWLKLNNISLIDLKRVTFSLVMGTFHVINNEARRRVWDWIKETFSEFV